MTTDDPTNISPDEGFEGPDIERSVHDAPVTDPVGDSELDDSADSYVSPARKKRPSNSSAQAGTD